jgi:hypothetical protein
VWALPELLLSHHPPGALNRCFRLGRFHVCRRCAVLYPVAAAVTALSLGGIAWPRAWDQSLLWLAPLPVTLEFLLERFGALRYRPRRQIVLTLLAAPALGRGFARYLQQPTDSLFWGMVLLYGGASLFALLATRRSR